MTYFNVHISTGYLPECVIRDSNCKAATCTSAMVMVKNDDFFSLFFGGGAQFFTSLILVVTVAMAWAPARRWNREPSALV